MKNPNDYIPQDILETAKGHMNFDNELYEKYNVKRGLRNRDNTGVLVGLTAISEVHGYIIDENEKVPDEGRLRYRGINVRELVNACVEEDRFGFEETVYLLLLGQLPSSKMLHVFTKYLAEQRVLPDNFVEDMILKTPSHDIMNKLARTVLALYTYDDNPDDLSLENILLQSFKLIARFPLLVAYAYQAKIHYYDHKSLVLHSPRKDLSFAENFLYLMRPDNKFTDREAKVLDLCLILHAEHGGGNNSAFTTHVVSSSDTDTYSAISAAIGALKGPKHGGANNRVKGMMDEIKENVSDMLNEDEVRAYLKKIINKEAYDKTGLIYGFGHAVYTISDPRAVLLKESARKLAEEKGQLDDFEFYCLVERLVPEIFYEKKGNAKLISPNVDFFSGLVYSMLDIPAELFTPIFAMSRVAGWCAHRVEEVTTGKKIIRPAYKSVCKKEHYKPINERN